MERDKQRVVLVTRGAEPFSQRVGRLLAPKFRVLFGGREEVPDVLLASGNYMRLPPVEAPAFVHEMLKLCLDKQVDVLIPLGTAELHAMAEACEFFAEYGIAVWIPGSADLPDELNHLFVLHSKY